MSSLEEARSEFWDAWHGLSEVHTQEDLDVQSEKMWAARSRLLKVDPEFSAMLKARGDRANAEAEESKRQIRSRHKVIISEAEAEVSAAKTRARAVTGLSDEDIDKWVQRHKFKAPTPGEAKTKSKLICPICHGPDRKNLVNGEPGCVFCMHVLVPESELRNYNRAYRRRWKKRRGLLSK